MSQRSGASMLGAGVAHKMATYLSTIPTEVTPDSTTGSLEGEMLKGLAAATDGPFIFRLHNAEYVALGNAQNVSLAMLQAPCFLTAIPVIPGTRVELQTFLDCLDFARHQDDVSRAEFRNVFLFCATMLGKVLISKELSQFLEQCDATYMAVEITDVLTHQVRDEIGHSVHAIPGGPYLFQDNKLRPIYRLYEDGYGTCMEYFQPSMDDNPFRKLRISGNLPQTYSVAVPPRSMAPPQPRTKSAIFGRRIVVKDIFDIKGFRISACDRAYYDMSEPASVTAPMIQRLMDSGAIILGKTKLSSMISREEPCEAVDYHVPFNPRGDGYQSPAGSSSGPAAAVAAYDWLDYAVGTDSTGSGRRPALVNGCFGLRLSTGALPADGMMPCFPLFDTPALFSRDIRGFKEFVSEWCGKSLEIDSKVPTSIIYPLDYLPVEEDDQMRVLNRFVADLAVCFGISIRKLRFDDMWAENPPSEAKGSSLYEYLKDAGRNSFFYDFYHSTDEFRKSFERRYCATPLVNRVTKWRWNEAEKITKADRDDAVMRMEVYKRWFLHHVLEARDSNPVLILPIAVAEPVYRDIPPGPPFAQNAWDELWLAPILGAPEFTVPIGQIKYHSRISNRTEPMPVAVSILGLPGTDLSLVDAVETGLRKSGRPLHVATGRQMFTEHSTVLDTEL